MPVGARRTGNGAVIDARDHGGESRRRLPAPINGRAQKGANGSSFP
jgi:hypothetical protein